MDVVVYALSKKYTDAKVAPLASGMIYKGNKATASELPLTGNKKGDVWTTADTGAEYVWTLDATSGQLSDWQELGRGGSNPQYIELTFYNDGGTGTLTAEQKATLVASELNYIWLNGMHRCDFRYRDDNNNKATYSAVDTSSDGTKTHSVEINLTTGGFTVYHKTLQEKLTAGDNITISAAGVISAGYTVTFED